MGRAGRKNYKVVLRAMQFSLPYENLSNFENVYSWLQQKGGKTGCFGM